jgi:hypothetical protein
MKLLPILPLLGSALANPLAKRAVHFVSPGEVSPEAAHNIVVEYFGDVDGELTITYGPCHGQTSILDAHHSIGATHVGIHPLAKRHLEHEARRPTKFVWVTPSSMSNGCLQAFIDGELIGQSEELVVTKRRVRRSEKKSFADVAGDDSMWFNGVAYLQQKQPEESFVAAAKSKSFAILGGGISGLASSVSLRATTLHSEVR